MQRYVDAFSKSSSILHKFHTVNTWYHFLTVCEKFVQICHIFRTNTSHFVKNVHEVKFHLAYMRIPHIDKNTPISAAFCIAILCSFVTDIFEIYQSSICVIIWYRIFTCVGIWYQLFTCESFDTNFSYAMI